MRKHNLIFIAVFLLSACTTRTGYNKLLVQADSLMYSHPDSALYLLGSIIPQQLTTQADKAYYALLLTQAKDKNYITQTDDSLIRMAVHYYDTSKNTKMQARAYYCWGGVCRDKNEYPQAIEKYLIALSHTASSENSKIRASLYSNIGYLYYNQWLTEEASSIYHQAEQLALKQKDTIALCYALIQQGMISLEQGEAFYPKAEQQMLQALSVSETLANNTVLTSVYGSLSTLYNSIPNAKKALQYSRLSYSATKDTLRCYRTFFLLGNAYFLSAQYDSACIFLRRVLAADRYYDTKADACMRLSEIAQLHGDIETAALMERKRAICLDSAQANQQGHGILNTVISHERTNNKRALKHRSHIIFGILAASSLVCTLCMIYFQRKLKRYKTEKNSWKEMLQAEIAQSRFKEQEAHINQQKKELLQEELNQLTLKKQAYAKEVYKTSAIYTKVTRIANELVRTDTKENLCEEEWIQFIALTNAGWNGIITHLNESYDLSTEEIQICCLYLAQVPVKHIGHFIKGQVRSTIQLKSKSILQKIEAPQGVWLKNALFSLADKLKNNK